MRRRAYASSFELACPFCGETAPVDVDEGGGEHQDYVEDCPVCCHPRMIHIAPSLTGQELEVWCERS
jgi:hypothetical protein